MQQAYFSESNAYGGWTLIGYTAPNGGNSNNFEYKSGSLGVGASTQEEVEDAWTAYNKVKLNDCAPGDNWIVSMTAIDADNPKDVYTASIAEDNADCMALTPTFSNIGK